jgi:hypothetical protein
LAAAAAAADVVAVAAEAAEAAVTVGVGARHDFVVGARRPVGV